MSVSVILKNTCKTTGEGPHWDDSTQTLLYVDIVEGDVHRFNPATNVDDKRHVGVNSSLIVPCSSGGYIIAVGHTLGRLDWDSNTYTQFVDVDQGTTNRFNDGKCDATGRLWAGTMGIEIRPAEPGLGLGSLYTLDSQRRVVKHLSNLNISNGLAWTEDNRIMYFIDSVPGSLTAFDFDLEKGTINTETKRVVRDFSNNAEGSPDGMTIDVEGKLWVACYSAGQVIKLDPETGAVLQRIKFPTGKITSCCFGGKNLDELYVTSSAYGYSAEEMSGTQTLAGSIFKVTGVGSKGRPANTYKD